MIDDVPNVRRPFPKIAKAKPGEAVVFSWIVYKSRAHRDAVNKKVMADPRCRTTKTCRSIQAHVLGGFKTLVDL